MRYRLIAMDLDGTLNNDEKRITPRTHAALMRVQQEGIRLALSSARPLPGLYRDRDALRLQCYHGILMAYNGGRIVDAATGETLCAISMTAEEARNALRMMEALPVTPIVDDGARFYVADLNGYMVAFECRVNAMTAVQVPNLAEYIHFDPAKLLLAVQPDELSAVRAAITRRLPPTLTVVQTAPYYLEIIPRSVNKGRGLMDICRVTGIDPREVIAFGDSENDIEMLRVAGVGVAMDNASSRVKAAADRVTLSNNDDGIAEALSLLVG
jgi:Cof subfamily protein (haloacid dehalogenase superfamily)